MPTTTSPPILIWQPGGGTPIWTPAPPPAGHAPPENGLTALTIGQNYVDVVFVTTQPRADWTFAGLEVVNVTDTAPLNIWVGVATSKTRNGFRVYLNGLPDTGNYYLDWSINGGTVADAGTATTYLLSGPDSGPISSPTTFTVALAAGTTLEEPMTVTPDDGGVPGTFSPATVELTSDMPSANFIYTPGSYGARTITVTNDQLLIDPGGVSFTSVVATYLLSGPSSGVTGVASTNFTVSLPAGGVTLNTITVTPTDALPTLSAGAFTPSSVNLTTGAPSATFTYTPLVSGAKTISTTNNRSLTDPGSLTYNAGLSDPTTIPGCKLWLKADSLALSDGAAVAAWNDSSSNAYNVTGVATFKTAIVNGKPVVRFNGTAQYMSNAANISIAQPDTVFVVGYAIIASANCPLFWSTGQQALAVLNPGGQFYINTSSGGGLFDAANHSGAFHVFTAIYNGASSAGYVDGALIDSGNIGTAPIGAVNIMNNGGGPNFGTGDIAEILVYNSALSTSDRQAVELYLKTKYATP